MPGRHAWAGCDSLKLCKSGTLGVSMDRSRPPGGKRGEHTRWQPYRCRRLFGRGDRFLGSLPWRLLLMLLLLLRKADGTNLRQEVIDGLLQ